MCYFFASHIPDRGSRIQTGFDQISPLASSTRDLGTRLGFWLNIKLILYICGASVCYPWFKFYFLLFKLIIMYYYTEKQRKLKFKPRIKLNHNIKIIQVKVRNLVVLFVRRSPHYFVQFRNLKKHFFHKSFGLTIETIEAVFRQLFGQLLDHLAPFRKVKIHSCIFILVTWKPNYNIPLHPLPSPPKKNIQAKVLYSRLC